MKSLARTTAAVLFTAALAAISVEVSAESASPAPAASRYYPFVGEWKGQGEFTEPGQAPAKLALTYRCEKAASGWAVRCDLTAKNDQMTMTESDLMGVDPVTNIAHWYAVTNTGEVHDHVVEWADDKTANAHITWTQEGRKMEEKVTFKFVTAKSMEFRSAVTADGTEVGRFAGTMTR